MKRSFLLFTATAGMMYVTLTSSSGGPATGGNGNRTGSPMASGTCGNNGCHGAQSNAVTIQMGVVDVTVPSSPVTVTDNKYLPGHVYEITLTGNNTTAMSRWGFQALATKSDNSQGGSIAKINTSDPYNVQTVSGVQLIEHNQKLVAGTPALFEAKFKWTAPAAGNGAITFYSIMNAVNNNNVADANDKPSNTFSLVLNETPASIASLSEKIKITAYPNPIVNNVTIKMDDAEPGLYTVRIMDMTGKTLETEFVQVNGSNANINLQTANWASGVHFVQIIKDGAQRMIPLVKQ